MNKKIFFHILFFIICTKPVIGQDMELTGAFIIAQSEVMSYKIVYSISNGIVSGYSISDLYGDNETTCEIKGTFNKKQKNLKFIETKILNSKSKTPSRDFCLMSVNGKFVTKLGKEMYQANFYSKSSNVKMVCDSGSILMTNSKTLYETAAQYAKQIKAIPGNDSATVALNEKLNELKDVNKIKEVHGDDVLNLNWKSDSVRLEIWDDKLEDGDIISIAQNGKIVFSKFEIKNKSKIIKLPLLKGVENIVTVNAITEGLYPPNTAKIYLIDNEQKYLILSSLKKAEKATFKLKMK